MAKRFELLVFDWDGTLSDSSSTIVSALQKACAELGLSVPSRDAALHIIGLGLREGLFRIIPGLTDKAFDALVARYRQIYFLSAEDVSLYPGVSEGLLTLKETGFCLAVATGKSRKGLDLALKDTKIEALFDMTRCADESFSKPHPQMLHEIMEQLGVVPAKTLMIGDTTHDLQMAANANVAAIGLSYGAHPVDQLLSFSPEACFDQFALLVEWIIDQR